MSECVVLMDIDEMPTACGPCELSCTAFCKEWTKVDRKEIGRTKSPNCPIIAILPEGHGRLVDADELKEWLIDQIDYYKRFDGPNCSMMVSAYEAVCRVINDAPTIVPAEAERSET